MKLNKLKNIIRESIKELITEQYTGPAKSVYLVGCDGTNIGWWFVTVGGATPQIGDVAHVPPGAIPHFSWSNGKAVYIVDVQPPYGGTGGNAFPIAFGGSGIDPTTGLNSGWNSPTHPNAYPGGPMWPFDLTPGDGGGFGAPSGCPNCTNWVVPQAFNSNNPGGCNNGNTTSSCDTTPASACATQWFGPNASNFTAWMASKDCSNYQSVVNNLETQANALMTAAPTPQSGPYSDWNAIKNAANASGLGQPQKGQFKRKMAKAMYSQCQIQACNC